LVVRAGALGDTLMATPVVRALAARYRGAEIDFLCSASAAPLLEGNPAVTRILSLKRRNVPWLLSREKYRLALYIMKARYDLAVLLESALHFYELVRYAKIPEIRTFGDSDFDPALHSAASNLRVAGFDDWRAVPGGLDMDLFVSPEEEAAAERLLASSLRPPASGLRIGLHAGWGPRGKKNKNQGERLKGWGLGNFIELGRLLAARGCHLALTGSEEDRSEAEAIAAGLPAGSATVLAGRTSVRQLAAVIRRLNLFVSVDTGPAHMAAAVGTPLVVLWGPSKLRQVAPISSRSPVRIVRHAVFCAPCYDTPMMETCRRNICMESISPQRVLREVEGISESLK
jgi:ADP-heptose:LPS heptosyltransferase